VVMDRRLFPQMPERPQATASKCVPDDMTSVVTY
jgi:hypothetical protein